MEIQIKPKIFKTGKLTEVKQKTSNKIKQIYCKKNEAKILANILLKRFAFTLKASSVK